MTPWVFQLSLCWLIGLSSVLTIYASLARSVITKVLAFDTLALTLVGVLSLLASQEQHATFLDLGLVVAMLGYVQTLAAVRVMEKRAATK